MLKENEIFLIKVLSSQNLSIIEIFKQTDFEGKMSEIHPAGKFPKITETLRKRKTSFIF